MKNLETWPRCLRTVIGIAVGAGLASGCSGPDRSEKAVLPAPASSSSLTKTPSGSPEEAARAAYLKYWDALAQSWSIPVSRVETHLARYAADPLLSAQVRSAKNMHKFKQTSAGRYKANITSVKITKGDEPNSLAYITDCQDASAVHLVDVASRRALQGSGGKARNGIRMTFARTPDGWLAFRYEQDKKACT